MPLYHMRRPTKRYTGTPSGRSYPAAALAAAKESGRQNSGIVQDQTIALVQILGQFVEMTVLNLSRLFIQMKQPGSVTLFQRGLRDQLLGQIKEKI